MNETVASSRRPVLLVGGTGRTGSRVLGQLLERGVPVCAIVRSSDRLPPGVAGNPLLSIVEADLLSLSSDYLRGLVSGCEAVISCLGHTLSVTGLYGSPRRLVTQAVMSLCGAAEATDRESPLKLILMSSVSVNRPSGTDARRSAVEMGFLWVVRRVLPPARDNQRAADFLAREIGADHPSIEWVVIRPDTLLEGYVSDYELSEGLVRSIFRPGETNMSNVAHFMCQLATDAPAWQRWKATMPVIMNA